MKYTLVLYLLLLVSNAIFSSNHTVSVPDNLGPTNIGSYIEDPSMMWLYVLALISVLIAHVFFFRENEIKETLASVIALSAIGFVTSGNAFGLLNISFYGYFIQNFEYQESIIQSVVILVYGLSLLIQVANKYYSKAYTISLIAISILLFLSIYNLSHIPLVVVFGLITAFNYVIMAKIKRY